MKPRWVVAQRELAGVFRERTILLAVIIQVVVAGFSSFLVIGLSALVDPSAFPASSQAQVAVNPAAAADAALVAHLEEAGLRVVPTDSDETAWNFFQRNGVDGLVLAYASDDPDSTVAVTLVLPESDIRTTLTLVQVKNALERYEQELRTAREDRLAFDPIYVETDAKSGSYAFVYSLLVPLLVFLPVVLAGALCADSITEEVQRKTLPLLLASPATPADVVEGKLLANSAIAPLLASAWFLLLGMNGLPVGWQGALAILVMATAIAYLLGLLACAIALGTRDRNKAHVIYASVMFVLLGLSLALPVSPINAVALLAAGSASAGAYALVAGLAAAALTGAVVLRLALRRAQTWMAAGGV